MSWFRHGTIGGALVASIWLAAPALPALADPVRIETVVGDIEVEAGELPAGAVVELQPLPFWPNAISNPADEKRLYAEVRQTIAPAADGSFAFPGLAPGWFELRATAPGYAVTLDGPFEVKPHDSDSSAVRKRLRLHRPAVLRVEITPALDPQGLRWQIELHGSSGIHEDWPRFTADENGMRTWAFLVPGRYSLYITGKRGFVWASSAVEIQPGMPPLTIAIPVVEVEGRLTRGGEPVAATLWFQAMGLGAELQSGVDGSFRGTLPGAGTWGLEVHSWSKNAQVPLAPVEVRRPSGGHADEPVRLDIEIPATDLVAEVVDLGGRPVQAARLEFIPAELRYHRQFLADGSGKVHQQGLPPGSGWIYAWTDDGSSALRQVHLDVGGLSRSRLTVLPVVRLRGRVTSARGPESGAYVIAVANAVIERAGRWAFDHKELGTNGTFDLGLTSQAKTAQLLVMARGHGLRWLSVGLAGAPEMEISLPAKGGGTLALKLAGAGGRDVFLGRAGGYVPVSELSIWAGIQAGKPGPMGDEVIVDNVESGSYSLCSGESVTVALLAAQVPPAGGCVSGELAPGGELVLDISRLSLPSPPAR